MKKTLILIFAIIFMNSAFAHTVHKEQYIRKNYGNVKTYLRTGYTSSFEIQKVKIIGLLSEILCKKMNYKDSIVLEFNHDYLKSQSNLTLIENGNTQVDWFINYGEFSIDEQTKIFNQTDKKGICIRQLNYNFNIINTLKLVEYCILNKNKYKNEILNFTNQVFYCYGKPDGYIRDYKLLGLNLQLVKNITEKETSFLLTDLINREIQFYNIKNIKGFWKNKEFTFIVNDIEFLTQKVFCIVELNKGVLIFETQNSFRYLAEGILNNNIKKLKISNCLCYDSSEFVFADFYYKLHPLQPLKIYSTGCKENNFLFSEKDNKIID